MERLLRRAALAGNGTGLQPGSGCLRRPGGRCHPVAHGGGGCLLENALALGQVGGGHHGVPVVAQPPHNMGPHQPAAVGQGGMELEQLEGGEGNSLTKGRRGGMDGIGTENLQGFQLARSGARQVRIRRLFNLKPVQPAPVPLPG